MKLQHVLVSRPEISAVSDLAGKRIGAGSFGTLPAYEVRVLIEKYRLGANTIIVPLNSTLDRMIATQRGTLDATVVPVPSDLKAEEMGLKRLLQMGSILPIPQAGFATSEEKIKTARQEIVELLKVTIEGIDFTWTQSRGDHRDHRQVDQDSIRYKRPRRTTPCATRSPKSACPPRSRRKPTSRC